MRHTSLLTLANAIQNHEADRIDIIRFRAMLRQRLDKNQLAVDLYNYYSRLADRAEDQLDEEESCE
jgi:hypothetical protein